MVATLSAMLIPLRPTVQLVVLDEIHPLDHFPAVPSVILHAERRAALRAGRPGAAAGCRHLLEVLADEEPTWHDAEWC